MLSISLALLFAASGPAHGASPAAPVQEGTTDAETTSDRLTPQHVRLPGSLVSLVPPAGFVPASTFAGWQHFESGCTIMVVSVPGPYAELISGFEDEDAMHQRGMQLVGREDLPMSEAGADGVLLRVLQQQAGQEYAKVIWSFGTATKSEMIVAMCTTQASDEWLPRLERAVRSAVWQPDLVLDPFEGIPFTIGDHGGLEVFMATSAMIGFSYEGEIDEEKSGSPFFLCVPAIRSGHGERTKQFTRRLRSTPLRKETLQGDPSEVVIDGLPGLVGTATAIEPDNDGPRSIYQVMLFDGSTYWLMQGMVRTDAAATSFRNFQRMAESFRRKWDVLTSQDGTIGLEVPATWNMRDGLRDGADVQAGFPVGEQYLLVLSDLKADLEGDHATLRGFAELTRSTIASQADGDLEEVETRIGGLPALVTSLTFQDGEDRFRYHHHAIEGRDRFYQLVVWSYDGDRETSPADLERIRSSFTIQPATDAPPDSGD